MDKDQEQNRDKDQEKPDKPEKKRKKKRAKKDKQDKPGAEMTFLEHLEELRRRIFISVGTIFGCFIFLYSLTNETIRRYFMMPMQEAIEGKGTFQFTSPAEGFLFDLKLALVVAIFAASPMLFYQFWAFVAPALYKKEKKYVIPFLFFSTVLFVGGAVFGYFIVFPIGFQFFSQFATEGVSINPKLNEYFSFATKLLLAFGLTFELPLILVFLGRVGLIDVKFLNRNRKYAIIILVTLAAMFTPPDVISQILLAAPLWILYEVSTLLVWITQRRQEQEQEMEKDEEQEPDPSPAG
jgi:sec-independent protein translocase protein TatC